MTEPSFRRANAGGTPAVHRRQQLPPGTSGWRAGFTSGRRAASCRSAPERPERRATTGVSRRAAENGAERAAGQADGPSLPSLEKGEALSIGDLPGRNFTPITWSDSVDRSLLAGMAKMSGGSKRAARGGFGMFDSTTAAPTLRQAERWPVRCLQGFILSCYGRTGGEFASSRDRPYRIFRHRTALLFRSGPSFSRAGLASTLGKLRTTTRVSTMLTRTQCRRPPSLRIRFEHR